MALNQPINTETSGYSRHYRRLVARNPLYLMVRDALAILRRFGAYADLRITSINMVSTAESTGPITIPDGSGVEVFDNKTWRIK